jgi:hypothetical protein
VLVVPILRDPEAGCEPWFGEGFHVEYRREQSHGRFDKFVQAIEQLASRRFVIGGLQKKNHGDHDGELKKGKQFNRYPEQAA